MKVCMGRALVASRPGCSLAKAYWQQWCAKSGHTDTCPADKAIPVAMVWSVAAWSCFAPVPAPAKLVLVLLARPHWGDVCQ